MITQRLAYAGCILSAAALAMGFYIRGFVAGSVLMIALGFLWLLGIRRRWGWVSSNIFLLIGIINAILLLIQSPPYLEVVSLSSGLIAWDLDHYQTRLERIRGKEMARSVEKGHVTHLTVSVGLGLLAAAAAVFIHVQLSFAMAMLTGGAALLLLIQVVNRLSYRRKRLDRPGQSQKLSGTE
jgi:MFS family permease